VKEKNWQKIRATHDRIIGESTDKMALCRADPGKLRVENVFS